MLYLPDCHCAKPQCKQLDGGQMYLMHCFKGISQLWGMLTEQSGWSPGSLQSERIWIRFPKVCPLALWPVTSCYLVEFLEPPPEVLLARNQAFWYMFLGFVLFFSFLRKGTSYANHKKCLCSLVFNQWRLMEWTEDYNDTYLEGFVEIYSNQSVMYMLGSYYISINDTSIIIFLTLFYKDTLRCIRIP